MLSLAAVRLALLSVLLVMPILLAPGAVYCQEVEPLPIAKMKSPEHSVKPFIFTAILFGLLVGCGAALTAALTVVYRSQRISGSTVLFFIGAFLVTLPFCGIIGAIALAFIRVLETGNHDGPPEPAALANDLSASLMMHALVLAVPFGIVAIIAAFYFKKPVTSSRLN